MNKDILKDAAICLVPLLMGFVFFYILTIKKLYDVVVLLHDSGTTQGIIIETPDEQATLHRVNGAPTTSTVYGAVYKYTVNGKEYIGSSHVRNAKELKYSSGERISVVYSNKSHDKSRINSISELYVVPILSGCVSSVFIWFGIFYARLTYNKSLKDAP